jgi:flagellar motor switch protein FliM
LANILSQEEVDALLKGIAGGDVDTTADVLSEPSGMMLYDLTSQERIIRGHMPTFEMMNEKFARLFRTTLSGLLRKVINISTTHTDMVEFGEFLKILSVPTSLHLFKMEPLRGTALIVVESKIIFMLVDVIFGGSGKESFKIEGREFTAIENNIIKKIVIAALADLEKIWHPLGDIRTSYQRSEVNPQFAHVVSPTEMVIVANFEVEVEYSSGMISICLPYAMLEPIRERLQAGFQSEQMGVDKIWFERFKKGLIDSPVEVSVELGTTTLPMRDVLHMKKGDVIPLDQYVTEPLTLTVEGVPKFTCYPGTYKGSQAVRIVGTEKENFPEV